MGTCSSLIDFEVEDGILKGVHFTGGCNGNLKGISALVEGMKIDEVIARLEGQLKTAIRILMEQAKMPKRDTSAVTA